MNKRFTIEINNKDYIGLLTFNQNNKNYLVYTDSPISNDEVKIYTKTFTKQNDNIIELNDPTNEDYQIIKNKINDLSNFLG